MGVINSMEGALSKRCAYFSALQRKEAAFLCLIFFLLERSLLPHFCFIFEKLLSVCYILCIILTPSKTGFYYPDRHYTVSTNSKIFPNPSRPQKSSTIFMKDYGFCIAFGPQELKPLEFFPISFSLPRFSIFSIFRR